MILTNLVLMFQFFQRFLVYCQNIGAYWVNSFHSNVFHRETSNWFCTANQMTGFYMKCNNGMKWITQTKQKQLIFHVGSLDLNLLHTGLPHFRPLGEINKHFLQKGATTLDLTFFTVVGLSTKEMILSNQCCFIPPRNWRKSLIFWCFQRVYIWKIGWSEITIWHLTFHISA